MTGSVIRWCKRWNVLCVTYAHAKTEPLLAVEIANVVVVDVDYNALARRSCFFAAHARIPLINGITPDATIPNRFAEMSCQNLLPPFMIADSLAARKTVAISIEPTSLDLRSMCIYPNSGSYFEKGNTLPAMQVSMSSRE